MTNELLPMLAQFPTFPDLPQLGHLPPGTPALLLIIGGLALAVPAATGILLRPAPNPTPKGEQAARSVLTHARGLGQEPIDFDELTLVDQALERVHRAGYGDPRILQSEANTKVVRVLGCACSVKDHSCAESRAALEEAIGDALGRNPDVTESRCSPGRCEFVVTY